MNTNKSRVAVLAGAGLLALGVGLSSTAFACFAPGTDPTISIQPNRAPAGTAVAVRGTNWAPGPVELRWAAADGLALGTATASTTNGSFFTQVSIPDDAEPGRSAIVAVQPGKSKSTTQSVQVTSPAADSTVDDTAADASTPAPATTGQTSTGTAGQPAAQATLQQVTDEPTATATATGAAASRSAAAAARRTSSLAVVARRPAADGQPSSAVVKAAEAATPGLARLADNDLWTAFEDGRPTAAVPALTTLGTADDGGLSSGAMGMGLLAAGIGALLMGFGAAEASRRRATVGSDTIED
ncbi:MAG TPA: hypothetical protein VMZ73_09895 [Acidimicrobiales bacterium]|nr:hypothetical protein [Acidimicrobiales bacterium]